MHAEMPIHTKGGKDPFGLQLWIDLPKEHKLVPPSYQELKAAEIPSLVYFPVLLSVKRAYPNLSETQGESYLVSPNQSHLRGSSRIFGARIGQESCETAGRLLVPRRSLG